MYRLTTPTGSTFYFIKLEDAKKAQSKFTDSVLVAIKPYESYSQFEYQVLK